MKVLSRGPVRRGGGRTGPLAPDGPWLWIFSGLLLTALLLRDGLLLFFSATLLLPAILIQLWQDRALDEVSYRRRLIPAHGFPGDQVTLEVEVANAKLLPLPWLSLRDTASAGVTFLSGRVVPSASPRGQELHVLLSLWSYERVRRRYSLRCPGRGCYPFGPVRLEAGDPFGFGQQHRVLEGEDLLVVYPPILPLEELGLPAGRPFGDVPARGFLHPDPARYAGVRDYGPGDPPRRIHWPATARTGRLQSRLLEPSVSRQWVIALNAQTEPGPHWTRLHRRELIDLGATVAGSLAAWVVGGGEAVGLATNGLMARGSGRRAEVPPSRQPGQLAAILEALARLLPFAADPFEGLLEREARLRGSGTRIIAVTAVLSDSSLEAVARLARRRVLAGLVLLDGDLPAPEAAGIPVYRVTAPPDRLHLEADGVNAGLAP